MNYLCKTLIIILFFSSSVFADNNWQTQQLTLSDYFSNMTDRSMALDSSNHPHMVYGGDNLYHTYFNGSTWGIELLDSSPGVGKDASIIFDSSNKAYVTYVDEENSTLMFLTIGAAGAIGAPVILDNIGRGGDTSIAVDSSGKIHISYQNNTDNTLSYISIESNGDVNPPKTVDEDDSTGYSSSIAVDNNGRVHISYRNNTHRDLKYARLSSSGFVDTILTLDIISAGADSSIAVDTNGKVHISYNRSTELAYITVNTDDTTNAPQILDTHGSDSSIAIDSTGKAHISYYNSTDRELRYITISNNIPSSSHTIDSVGDNVGLYSSIVTDTTNTPHFFYFDDDNFSVKYAYNNTTEFLHQGGESGEHSAVVVDGNEISHIVFYDTTDRHLKYFSISPDGIASAVQTLDNADSVGQYPSISVDSNGKKHIGYFDEKNYDLKYTTISAVGIHGTPQILVDTTDQYHNITINNDTIHILYNTTDGDLYYKRGSISSGIFGLSLSVGIGTNADIVVDTSGIAHIIYRDGYTLKYTTASEGGIINPGSTLANSGFVQDEPVINIDHSSTVHVTYVGGFPYKLKHQSIINGVASPVDDIDDIEVGLYHDMTIDHTGKVHLSYTDNDTGQLKYAAGFGTSWHNEVIENVSGKRDYARSSISVGGKQIHVSYSDRNLHELKHAYKPLSTNSLVPVISYLLIN